MSEPIPDERETAAAPVAAASVTTSTVAVIVWAVDRYLFPDSPIPPEVYGFLQVAVPSWTGFLAAEIVHWQRRRHRRN
jgi:hypothetical protein